MSLINQMLKDLEKRRAKDNSANSQPDLSSFSFSSESLPPYFKTRKFFLAAGITLAIVLLLLLVWVLMPSGKKQVLEKKASQFVKKVLPTKSKPTVKPKPKPMIVQVVTPALSQQAVLNAINMIAEDNKVTVNINVSSYVHYSILKSQDHRSVVVTLNNTSPTSSFKLPVSFNAIVQSIKTRKFNDDLQIIFMIQKETKITNLQYTQKQPLNLQVIFVNPSIKVQDKEQPIKSKMVVVPLTMEQKAQAAYQKIVSMISAGQTNNAVEELKKFVVIYPNFVPARRTLIVLLFKQSNYRLASQYLDQAFQLMPESIDLIVLKARLYIAQGSVNRALKILQSVSPSLENAPDLYALMAAIQQRLGNPLIAAHLYAQLLTLKPMQSTWWMGLGLAFETAGRQNAAADAYKKAISTGNLSPNSQAYVATRLQKSGN